MKLSKYLADYIAHEHTGDIMDIGELQEDIQQGIEAFESTEGWVVLVVSKETAERIKELSE